MTVPRYIGIVTAVYFLALLATIGWVGDLDISTPASLIRLWPVLVGAIVLGALGTLAVIARFGNAAGSIYFLPTVLHVAIIVALAIVVLV